MSLPEKDNPVDLASDDDELMEEGRKPGPVRFGEDVTSSTSSNKPNQLKSRKNMQSLMDDGTHREEVLEQMRDSNAAKKSQDQNLKLDDWTKVANKKYLRQTNSSHSYRQTWCGGKKMTFEWLEHLIYAVIAMAVQIMFGHSWAFPDGLDAHGSACGDFRYNNQTMCNEYDFECGGAMPPGYCEEWLQRDDPCGGIQPNDAFCSLSGTLEWGHAQFKFLTPFILGGYVVSSVSLWRLRRTAYCALCGAVRNMNVNLASIVPLPNRRIGPRDTEQIQLVHARKTLARWSILGFELSILKARGLIDNEELAVPHLQQLGLLKDGEWDAMVPGDRHTTVWMWLQTMVMQLGSEEIINPHIHLQTLCTAITLLRDRANDLMSALDRDQPFPYASITGILVNTTLLLDALHNGHLWAIMLFEQGLAVYTKPKMWIELLILLTSSMLFGMLYDLAHILYNPFGARTIDLPHLAVGGGIRKMARSFATGDFLPPTLHLPDSSQKKVDISVSQRSAEEEELSEQMFLQITDQLKSRNKRGSIFSGVSKRW